MKASDTNITPERKETDENLQTERSKTDEAIIQSKVTLEEEADNVVLQARENADAILTAAREKADEKVHTESSPAPSPVIAENRVLEDEVIQLERDAADKNIKQERSNVNLDLKKMLPLERQATDKTLVTERAISDEALENRDDFLGMVCHDLRNILSGILITTELLALETPDHETAKPVTESVLQIKRYVAQMNRLIGDLIDVASIDSGKLSMQPVRQDTSLLLSEAIQTFKSLAEAKDISLEVEGLEGSLFADFDHDRMLQVLANLLTNSIKFNTNGGKIKILCEEKESFLQFCVSDTGPGIPQEMLESVFERFWQVGKNDRRGLGLGLYISRCIVESHGGKIWAESKLHEGSRFYFTLPKGTSARL